MKDFMVLLMVLLLVIGFGLTIGGMLAATYALSRGVDPLVEQPKMKDLLSPPVVVPLSGWGGKGFRWVKVEYHLAIECMVGDGRTVISFVPEKSASATTLPISPVQSAE